MDIVLKKSEVVGYVIEGLRKAGMTATEDAVMLKPGQNEDDFVVEVLNVTVLPPTQVTASHSPVKLAKPGKRLNLLSGERDDLPPKQTTELIPEDEMTTEPEVANPAADAAALGSRAFKSFEDIGMDPNEISQSELGAAGSRNTTRNR